MDFRDLLVSDETSELPQSQPPPVGEIPEIPQGEQQPATSTPAQPAPTPNWEESAKYFQSEHDKKASRLKEYEQYDPFIQKLRQDPAFLQANLQWLQSGGSQQATVQADPEPELDEIPTAEQVKAYNTWVRRQSESSVAELRQTIQAMQQQAQIDQVMQQAATDYLRMNPTASVQEAYEYGQWAISPANVTKESLIALFRAQRAGVNPAQAQVIAQIQANAARRVPGVTVPGMQAQTEPEETPEQKMKKGILATGNRAMWFTP